MHTKQDPAEIERHMAGKRFVKLKAQHDEKEALLAEKRARRHKRDGSDVDAIASRIGDISSDEDDEEEGDSGDEDGGSEDDDEVGCSTIRSSSR
jgi:hypothetical protein